MNTLLVSIKLACPLLLLIALGYFLKRINILDEHSSVKLSQLVLNVILPINIFISIYDSDFKTAFDIKLISYVLIANLIATIGIIIVAHYFTKDNRKLSALMQAGVRGNYHIFAMPLAVNIYGQIVQAPSAITFSLLTPLYNVYAIALFEHYQDSKTSFLKQIINVLKAPITVATILAIVLKIFNINIPTLIYDTLNYISKSLTAISLINLGSSFNFKLNKSVVKFLIIALVYKLILIPITMIPVGVLLGFRDVSLVVILVMATAPIATSAFSTAVCYDTDMELTNSAVVYSYVGCFITIPIFLSIITVLGLI